MHTTLHLCRLQVVVCVKNNKLKRAAADALGWRADTIKQMNLEAANAICKLCKKIAANYLFISEHLRPHIFSARLIPIAMKYGGTIRPIAIGTIFHKLISSAIMCNLKKKLPGTFSLLSGVGMPGGAENIVHGIRNHLSDIQTVSRIVFFKQVQDKFPLILP